ncbi:MAG: helicase-related protein [Bacillota bacterium]|jgi:hypothetical protein
MSDHLKTRRDILDAVVAELMGPGSEPMLSSNPEFEVISENPLQRYSVGILYPQCRRSPEDDVDEQNTLASGAETDEVLDTSSPLLNQYYPSAIGMSFFVNSANAALQVSLSASKYRRLEVSECRVPYQDLPRTISEHPDFMRNLSYKDGWVHLHAKLDKDSRDKLLSLDRQEPRWRNTVYLLDSLARDGWTRVPLSAEDCRVIIPGRTVSAPAKEVFDLVPGLRLVCIRRPTSSRDSTLFTVSMVNTNVAIRTSVDSAFFQVRIEVSPLGTGSKLLDYSRRDGVSGDEETQGLQLLYRKRNVYGVGHGCSVEWNREGTTIRTSVIPTYEVPQVMFDVPELSGCEEILSMRNLSDRTPLDKGRVIDGLNRFVAAYRTWIETEEKRKGSLGLSESQKVVAEVHLNLCREAADRMGRGIEGLKNNRDVWVAFQLANRAMLMQRAHSILQRDARFPDDKPVTWPDYSTFSAGQSSWRPFQLAFMLMNLPGLSDPNSPDRNLVDLIWFPTGGGKTEAYLGIAAIVLFLRRLRHPSTCDGTAIIMRYTLRLLTAQQFQRACTLICACELIRRELPELLGESSISIGLWIGHSSTPNTLREAFEVLDRLKTGAEYRSPFQVLSCPWCGTKLVRERNREGRLRGEWGYRREGRHLNIHCTDPTCPFDEGLPIAVVDEEIYRAPPNLLFATVDKFAQLPWKEDPGRIFALQCENRSPELIIQDELHLISGPLGTVVGLYETAVDIMCSNKGVPPKIVASTATIRSASQQVRALLDREVRVFPPPGIDAEDSFYSREAPLCKRPGRLYVGIMSSGRTQTTMQVRLLAALLQHIGHLLDEGQQVDPYWTLVAYFNTIRELGRCSTLIRDDIKDQVRRMANRHNREVRVFYGAEELTSRRHGAEIPRLLERLKVSLPDKRALDLLLASNMISVGVDIDRLGLMVVVSQPKSTSEYIQATSRVGRMYPGIVFALYDGARPRDRSHYERFVSYHQAFYRYVEPTSVTPFSGPARDRAMHAVLVTLVRHIAGLSREGQASDFVADLRGLPEIRRQILKRVESVMPEELDAAARQLDELIEVWSRCASLDRTLVYSNPRRNHLLYPAGRKRDRYWETLQSMRSVDAPCNIRIMSERR